MRIELTGWNRHSTRFVYAPRWTWTAVPNATAYEVMLVDQKGTVHRAQVAQPEWDAGQLWVELPVGPLDLLVIGQGADGTEICTALHRRFQKSPGFVAVKQPPLDWGAAVLRNVEYLLGPARDEVAFYEKGLPRSCWSSFEDSITGERTHLAYPALHHPSFIFCFLRFAACYPSHPLADRARRQAEAYGDWLLENRQSKSFRLAHFPLSTIQEGRPSGGLEGRTVTLVRAARVGEAMATLYRESGDARYLAYARLLADALVSWQGADGSWPYRVDPKDGTVVESYTSNAMEPARLLNLMHALEPKAAWKHARDRAVRWLINNPVKTRLWQGMYEDVSELPPYTNLQHWDANALIRYFVHYLCSDSEYLRMAEALNAFIEDQFVLWQAEEGFARCPTPAVLEQYRCYHPMEVHTGNWLLSLAALHGATGSDEYLDKAVAAANAIVRGQMECGAFSTWGNDQRFGRPTNAVNWPGCNACASSALMIWEAYFRALPDGPLRKVGLEAI